jgi:hypothetical protein
MQRNKRYLLASLLALAMAIATGNAVFAQSFGYEGRSGWRGRDLPSYAGDCKFPYPPGYRYDLKDWRTGFTDRDFSCYRLDQN